MKASIKSIVFAVLTCLPIFLWPAATRSSTPSGLGFAMREDILAKFPDAKRDGAGYAARCPAHDDHRASLSMGTPDPDDVQWLLERHKKLPLRKIYRAKLFNVSSVTWPAYLATTVDARDEDRQAKARHI
jgi:Caudovirus prohead serine protease